MPKWSNRLATCQPFFQLAQIKTRLAGFFWYAETAAQIQKACFGKFIQEACQYSGVPQPGADRAEAAARVTMEPDDFAVQLEKSSSGTMVDGRPASTKSRIFAAPAVLKLRMSR